MRTVHVFQNNEPAAPMRITLTGGGAAVDTLAIAMSEANMAEDGTVTGYTVTEISDTAPRPAEYAAIVEGLIALRYTIGAEIAFTRKPDTDTEKAEYLAYVEAAKAAAQKAVEKVRGHA